MRTVWLCQLGLAVGVAGLAIVAGVSPTSAQERAKIEVVPNVLHSGVVASVAFSPDGKRVLSGSGDKTLKLWDAESGQLIRTFEGLGRHVGVGDYVVMEQTLTVDPSKRNEVEIIAYDGKGPPVRRERRPNAPSDRRPAERRTRAMRAVKIM